VNVTGFLGNLRAVDSEEIISRTWDLHPFLVLLRVYPKTSRSYLEAKTPDVFLSNRFFLELGQGLQGRTDQGHLSTVVDRAAWKSLLSIFFGLFSVPTWCF
jgi:hypothetical protein